MKKLIRSLSLFLTAVLLLGSLECLTVLDVFADETTTSSEEEEQIETIDYTTRAYGNDESRLADMTLQYSTSSSVNGVKMYYQIWADDYTGEVATVQCDANGNIINSIFTNPYDVGISNASDSIKQQIMSQITVKYTDNDSDKYFYSYTDAVLSDQIKVKNIKGGIRVEYTLGREEARMLVPRMISCERYTERLYTPIKEQSTDFDTRKFDAYYLEKDLSKLTSKRAQDELKATFPITEKFAVRVFDPTATEVEKAKIENYIKMYCPDYTYEEMDSDHQMCGYEGEDENPPLFKMALEYTLEEDGSLSVRLPANGIRFNESQYQLKYIEVLPYMGAGNTKNTGYSFYPDGAGTLFDFADPALKTKVSIAGKVYGTDFAYQTISGTYQQTIRYPVFGIVENTSYTRYYNNQEDSEDYEKLVATYTTSYAKEIGGGGKITDTAITSTIANTTSDTVIRNRGFVAVIEEGDALASISAYTDATENEYATMRMQFTPRPEDTYKLSDSIGVGSTDDWTVVCSRKYVGNYKIRYTMLTDTSEDNNEAAEFGIRNYYPTTWVGMALVYRDYLDAKGVLTRLKAEDVDPEHIPLYIETFGTLETTEKILSVPVDVMTPLTTFDNVKAMYEKLSKEGLTNINFKLTGYANGGMYSDVPYYLKWEKAVGGASGFKDLLAYAKDISAKDGQNMGIFPDFNFSYIEQDGLFDAVQLKQHAGKTIDDRYSKKREYSATQQKYLTWYEMVLSAAYMSNFYEHLVAEYLGKYDDAAGISVASLGYALNSDFDEDDPYNREDAKDFTVQAFKYFNDAGLEVMTNGGNAYTWQYADHILGMALDSSRYIKSSNSVPFIGVVLHGYLNFTDDPLNMEGDVQYALMKAIENGASIYFTLSYQNTQKLKNNKKLSQYYSVRFDIWEDDVIEYYNELNNALKDVQTKLITNHEFLSGTRIPDAEEIEDDYNKLLEAYYNEEYMAEFEQLKHASSLIGSSRTTLRESAEAAMTGHKSAESAASNAQTNVNTVSDNLESYVIAVKAYQYYVRIGYDKLALTAEQEARLAELKKKKEADLTADEKAEKLELQATADKIEEYAKAKVKIPAARTRLIRAAAQIGMYMNTVKSDYEVMKKLRDTAAEALEVLSTSEFTDDAVKATLIAEANTYYNEIVMLIESGYYSVNSKYSDFIEKQANGDTSIVSVDEEFANYTKYLKDVYVTDFLNQHEATGVADTLTENKETARKALYEAFTAAVAKYTDMAFTADLAKYAEFFNPDATELDPGVQTEIDKKDYAALEQLAADDAAKIAALKTQIEGLQAEFDEITAKVNYLEFNSEAERATAESNLKSGKGPCEEFPDGSVAYRLLNAKTEKDTLTTEYLEAKYTLWTRSKADAATSAEIAKAYTIGRLVKAIELPDGADAAEMTALTDAAKAYLNSVVEIVKDAETFAAYGQTAGAELTAKITAATAAQTVLEAAQAEFEAAVAATTKAANAVKSKTEAYEKKQSETNKKALDDAIAAYDAAVAAQAAAKQARNDALTAYAGVVGGSTGERMTKLIAVTDEYEAAVDAQTAATTANSAMKKVYDEKLAVYDTKKDDVDGDKVYKVYFAMEDAREAFEAVQAAGHTDENDIDYIKSKAKYDEAKENYESVIESVDNYQEYISAYTGYMQAKTEYNAAATALEEAKTALARCKNNYITAAFAEADRKSEKSAVAGDTKYTPYPKMSLDKFSFAIVGSFDAHYVSNSTAGKKAEAYVTAELAKDIDTILGVDFNEYTETAITGADFYQFMKGVDDCMTSAKQAFEGMRDHIVEISSAMDCDAAYKITASDINNKVGTGSTKQEEETEIEEFDKYLTDDGKIVAVTYGDKNAEGQYDTYKFFIINYNNFAVKVEYKNVIYTIPKYGYVAVAAN